MYVSASDHEGFCVPVVEAMGHGVPVVAYAAAAVPETVGGAGLLLDSKQPLRFAAAVARVLEDGALRDRMAAEATRRLKDFEKTRSADRFVDLLPRRHRRVGGAVDWSDGMPDLPQDMIDRTGFAG